MDSTGFTGKWVLSIVTKRMDLSAQWRASMVCKFTREHWINTRQDALSNVYIKLYTQPSIRDECIEWFKKLLDDSVWPNVSAAVTNNIPVLDDDFNFIDYADLATNSTVTRPLKDFDEIWLILRRNYWLFTTLVEALTTPRGQGFNLWIWTIKMGIPITDNQIDYFISNLHDQGQHLLPGQAITLTKLQPLTEESLMLLVSYGTFDAFNACLYTEQSMMIETLSIDSSLRPIIAPNMSPNALDTLIAMLSRVNITREFVAKYLLYMPMTGDLSASITFGSKIDIPSYVTAVADLYLKNLKKTVNAANRSISNTDMVKSTIKNSLGDYLSQNYIKIIRYDPALISIVGFWAIEHYRPVQLTPQLLTNIHKVLEYVTKARGLPQLSLYLTVLDGNLPIDLNWSA